MILIIALIALFYAVVAAINKFAGTSISATGIVCGAFMVALAFIGNIFVALWNLVVDVFVLIYNLVATVANFIAMCSLILSVQFARLFFDLADTVLGILKHWLQLLMQFLVQTFPVQFRVGVIPLVGG